MSEIQKLLLSDEFLKISFNEYKKFRESSEWDEQYKWDILKELNENFLKDGFNEGNILEKIDLLRKKNPSKGALVFWTYLNDLYNK